MKATVTILVLLTSAMLSSSSSGVFAGEPMKVKFSIPLTHVKGGFDLMAADVAGKRLFLAAEDNNTMEVLDIAAGKHLRSVGGLNEPKWIVYRPESNRLYVSNGGDGSVRVLDARTLVQVRQFSFKEKANNLRYDSKTKKLFVGVGKTFGAIGIIDTANDTILPEISIANYPKQFEVEDNRIFVNVPVVNHIAVIDRGRNCVAATWPVAESQGNVPMGFDREHHRLFVGCEPGKFVVLDSVTGKSVASLDIKPGSDGIYYDTNRHHVYVSCGAGSIEVIRQADADHYELIASVPTAEGAATSLFVPELDVFCLAVPQKEGQTAELRVYDVVR